MERKLTAIMFTDIVGYSKIMSTNEKIGLELLDSQSKLVLPIIKNFNGKVLKKMGDAFFVDFSSSINVLALLTIFFIFELDIDRHLKFFLSSIFISCLRSLLIAPGIFFSFIGSYSIYIWLNTHHVT